MAVPDVGWRGAVALAICLVITHYRLWRRVTPRRPLIDARVMNLLEDCKQAMGLRVPVTLVETPAVGSPSLFGFVRPRLLLPVGLTQSFSEEELRFVFLHELSHIKRLDILTGWLMTALQILHWFNPLVWLAFHRMRVDRELACDALALSYAKEEENQPYGRTIIKLLEGFGCSTWAPSMAGTVENRNQLKERISMIAKFRKTSHGPALAGVLFITLGLVTLTDAQTSGKRSAPGAAGGPPPNIVATSPAVGATDVDPGLTEITVTFDQDMGGGFSWTGGGPDYPPTPEGQKAQWQDKRTCVLPVKLEAGRLLSRGDQFDQLPELPQRRWRVGGTVRHLLHHAGRQRRAKGQDAGAAGGQLRPRERSAECQPGGDRTARHLQRSDGRGLLVVHRERRRRRFPEGAGRQAS